MIALLAMVIENPWHHHNVNHLLQWYIIAHQIKDLSFNMKSEDVVELSCMQEKGGGIVPYPMVAHWRRHPSDARMEDEPALSWYISDFQDFVSQVCVLYTRAVGGGLDAWQYMEVLRGERTLGSGQFGADVLNWCKFMNEHPASRALQCFRQMTQQPGSTRISFCIGGPYGHGSQLRKRADKAIRLSSMVLNHQIALIVLLEQIYRAWTILHGQKYHH